jgi:hypothetical protein
VLNIFLVGRAGLLAAVLPILWAAHSAAVAGSLMRERSYKLAQANSDEPATQEQTDPALLDPKSEDVGRDMPRARERRFAPKKTVDERRRKSRVPIKKARIVIRG